MMRTGARFLELIIDSVSEGVSLAHHIARLEKGSHMT